MEDGDASCDQRLRRPIAGFLLTETTLMDKPTLAT